MQYGIITFGCQMNHSDSERIAFLLEKAGHKPASDPKKADLVVLNACSVRQTAVHRIFSQIENYKAKQIMVAGCVLPKDRRMLEEKGVIFWHPDDYFEKNPIRKNPFSAWVPIMSGCDNYCSYCAVPFTRGPERSRPAKKILAEIKELAKKGYKEIVLLGQNVNSYKDGQTDFPALLEMIEKVPGDFRLLYLTSHPKDMSDRLIEITAKSKKLMPYVHLPVQSGDDSVLRRMNRHYTAKHYLGLISKLRNAFKKYRPEFPALSISTDVIAGFPGETKAQFAKTAKLMEKVGFDMAFLAQYSPRPGTAAARMNDNIDKKEKKRREEFLNDILRETARTNNKKYLGQTVRVLVEEIKDGYAFGKTDTYKNVKFEAKKSKPGQFVTVKITGTQPWSLKGEIHEK